MSNQTYSFSKVIRHLETQLSLADLPSEQDRLFMAPYKRIVNGKLYQAPPKPKLSAVLILLYPTANGETLFSLMLRETYKGAHSGQVSLPGGRHEKSDPHFEYTALRETNEEFGVPLEEMHILGKISEVYIPPSGFLVKPFVGYAKEAPRFNIDPREVKKRIEVPLSELMDESRQKDTLLELQEGYKVKVPYFDLQNEVVWGATALILGELHLILKNL